MRLARQLYHQCSPVYILNTCMHKVPRVDTYMIDCSDWLRWYVLQRIPYEQWRVGSSKPNPRGSHLESKDVIDYAYVPGKR